MSGILFPLDFTYIRAGLNLPVARAIEPAAIPASFQRLLVHSRLMTETLECHRRSRMLLRPLMVLRSRCYYCRRIALVESASGRVMEIGAIRLHLSGFEEPIRRGIVEESIPLGRLFRESNVEVQSCGHRFFELFPNSEMMVMCGMTSAHPLYGRRTVLRLDGRKVADIVEVLTLLAGDEQLPAVDLPRRTNDVA